MVRVVVAEDSPTARALLVAMLKSDPTFEVVGEAADGVEAIEMVKALRPDVVTMDIQMPRLDGFEATKTLMIEAPTPIVIISSLDVASVEVSMAALAAGALAVLPKPVGVTAPDFPRVTRHLLTTVRAMSQVKLVRRWPSVPAYKGGDGKTVGGLPPLEPGLTCIAIAASTGGPAAIHRLLKQLDKGATPPILVVQHISHGFAAGMASWLDQATSLDVRLAIAGERLEAGRVYLAPDDVHLGVSSRGTVALAASAPQMGFRPSASHLFETAGRALGRNATGVILTGMGSDGVEGLRVLHRLGGHVVAQDQATSDVYGMPQAASQAGVVDVVLPLDDIAPYLAKRFASRSWVSSS